MRACNFFPHLSPADHGPSPHSYHGQFLYSSLVHYLLLAAAASLDDGGRGSFCRRDAVISIPHNDIFIGRMVVLGRVAGARTSAPATSSSSLGFCSTGETMSVSRHSHTCARCCCRGVAAGSRHLRFPPVSLQPFSVVFGVVSRVWGTLAFDDVDVIARSRPKISRLLRSSFPLPLPTRHDRRLNVRAGLGIDRLFSSNSRGRARVFDILSHYSSSFLLVSTFNINCCY